MPWDELKPRQFPAFEKDLDGISKQTMEDHYKLYEGYAKKANECRRVLNEFDYSEIEGNQVYSELRAVSVDYTFALLGYKNHDLYFGHLGGDGAVWRTVVGVLFIALIGNGYILLGLDPLYEQITTGVILIAAVGLDVWARGRRG